MEGVQDGSCDILAAPTCDTEEYVDVSEDAGNPVSQASGLEDEEAGSGECPPLDLNYDALKHIASCYLPGDHGDCIDIKTLSRGSYHEIRILEFQDGWSCIGRFTRNPLEPMSVMESEMATVKYVRKHTSIPVPETYFVNFDPTHAVGAAFALMERMQGEDLYTIWDKLSTEHKKNAMEQIADVLFELSQLKFVKVGSITTNGDVGALQCATIAIEPQQQPPCGPFDSMEDYMFSFISQDPRTSPALATLYADIRRRLHRYIETECGDDRLYTAPFSIMHGDFEGQNLLFTFPDPSQPPKLSAVIDWDHSHSGPLYFLYEYPDIILDREMKPGDIAQWSENKILRKHFVQTLAQKFPKASKEREDVREAFRQKCFVMNAFNKTFMQQPCGEELKLSLAEYYTDCISGKRDEDLFPYPLRADWEEDSELGSDDEDEWRVCEEQPGCYG